MSRKFSKINVTQNNHNQVGCIGCVKIYLTHDVQVKGPLLKINNLIIQSKFETI